MAVAVFILCVFRGGMGQMVSGLPYKDSDDAMRMLQVLDLRNDGDWYDLSQPRLNPPAGVPMHWSRLPDLPILGMLAMTEPMLGRERAMLISAYAVPALLGVAFFAAFVWAATPLTGRAGQPFSGLIGLCLLIPMFAFAGGRIDHHGWQLLLAILSAGALLRVAKGSRAPGLPMVAGCIGALGLWVGAEAIPSVAFGAAVLTLTWLRQGRPGAAALAIFGVGLMIATTLIIPIALAPGERTSSACDAFSLLSVGLGSAVALFGVGALTVELTLQPVRTAFRFGVAALIGTLLLGTLYVLFPDCVGGPYAGLSAEAALLVERVGEAQPLWTTIVNRPALAAQFASLPLLALSMALWRSTRCDADERTLWLSAALLVAASILVQFWQLRASLLANAYAGLVLCWWAASVGAKIDQTRQLLPRLLRRAGPALLVALLPGSIVLLANTLTAAEKLDEPSEPFDIRPATALLNSPAYTMDAPLLIAAPINVGASLLLLTPHQVLAAPYHRNTEGLRDIMQVFYRDEATARTAITRRHVDLLLLYPDESIASHERREDSTLFYDELLQGETPEWLESVPLDGSTRLFRVAGPASGTAIEP